MAGSEKPRERLEWIDAAKGIGIIAVIAGHIWTRGPLRDAVYAFHMPLFFLISGYLCKPQPSLPQARKLLATQGLAYLLWLALVIALDIWIEGSRGLRPIFHTWPGDLGKIAFGGSELRGPFTVFWFVPCLLFARILCNAIGMRFSGGRSWAWIGLMTISLAIAYTAGAATDISPLGLLTVPMAMVLLWAGWVWRGVEWKAWMWGILLPISAVILAFGPPLNMKAGDYGWPLLSIAGAVAISIVIFRCSQWPLLDSALMRIIGAASLTIMYLHVPVVHYLTPYLGKPALLGVALLLPLTLHYLLKANRVTARLFLGIQSSRAEKAQPWSLAATSATRRP
ncbi:MAG: acyltransferase family protein [Sphingobium sp.]